MGGGSGCRRVDTPVNPGDLRVSPDGRQLYVAFEGASDEGGYYAGGLGVLEIDPQTGTVAAPTPAPRDGCGAFDCPAGSTAAWVELSPEGRFLYAGGGGESDGRVYRRSPRSGALTPERHYLGLARANAAELSADGRYLYVVGGEDPVLRTYARNGATGALRQVRAEGGCFDGGSAITPGCAPIGLDLSAADMTVTRDGRHVYVAGERPFDTLTIVALRRNPRTGTLTRVRGRGGCVRERASRGCRTLHVPRYGGLRRLSGVSGVIADLATDPRGRQLYVLTDRGVAVLRRDRHTGALSQPPGQRGCLANRSRGGCRSLLGVERPQAIAVDAFDGTLYIAGDGPRRSGVLARLSP